MTIDEELIKLEDDIRRLKIEWEVYFNGSSDRPPRDSVYRVETYIKRRTADQSDLNFGQRYKLNALAQKYAVQNALWKRRVDGERGRAWPVRAAEARAGGIDSRQDGLRGLFGPGDRAGEGRPDLASHHQRPARVGPESGEVDPARFQKYLCDKTRQIKAMFRCASVQFWISTEDGKLKFKAAKA